MLLSYSQQANFLQLNMSLRQIILKYFAIIIIAYNVFLIFTLIRLGFSINNVYFIVLAIVALPVTFITILSIIKLFGIRKFDSDRHYEVYNSKKDYPSVDVFLPICGESLELLTNTWNAVKKLNYPNLKVYVLDDRKEHEKKELAEKYGFNYLIRPNNNFKKAGNLRNGFENSDGDFILILDADFQPNSNFLDHTLPYFKDESIAIVQTPQAFKYNNKKGLEQGTANIQDFFYNIVQTSRNTFDAAMCVGTNGVYRRSALAEIGGNVLIEHSEDLWTGFALTKNGYKIKFLPIELSFGTCPDDIYSYFKQQTRWCQGSTSLVTSGFFWGAKISFMQRLSYLSGFLFYLYSANLLIYPLITLILILSGEVEQMSFELNILFGLYIAASVLLSKFVVYKGSNLNTVVAHCLATWSYTYALFNKLVLGRNEEWQATGHNQKSKSSWGFKFTILSIFIYTGLLGALTWYATLVMDNRVFLFYLYLNLFVHLTTILYILTSKK
jgi:cellulose synthase (UDP-forming)